MQVIHISAGDGAVNLQAPARLAVGDTSRWPFPSPPFEGIAEVSVEDPVIHGEFLGS
jgi:hypothetical protein